MKVFISWSGSLSKQVAELLSAWIEDVLQGVETWISTEDIEKGSIWFSDISDQLAEISAGIICLSRENIDAPWIYFEAGALSKGLLKNRVCPFLISLSTTDLKPPLSMFNLTQPKKDDMLKLIKTINSARKEKTLKEERLEKTFNLWWDEFHTKYQAILKNYKQTKEIQSRPIENMIEELLEISRSIHGKMERGLPLSRRHLFNLSDQLNITRLSGATSTIKKFMGVLDKHPQLLSIIKEETFSYRLQL